ncbi:hypothetical protein B0A48_11793 [Cryoendolithus antarcticus]|uniref:Cytochrome P450 monooxygenase n=1 Tax=Cryoendolithus antarcticus TaxID=1507870 RepID=A0A1V8ST52_9PEZI|nr:hypothetical protein B0A48_11793 [Cryoendolithus antarcticus]
MPSILGIVAVLLALCFLPWPYRFLRNLYYARKSGVPVIILPWDQDNPLWIVISVPLRPVLQKILPKVVFERIVLAIYGWEFHDKLRPFEQYAAPQGNDKTFFLATAGLSEITTRDPEVAWQIVSRPRDFQQAQWIAAFVSSAGPLRYHTRYKLQRKIITSVINERVSKVIFGESLKHTSSMMGEVFDKADGNAAESTEVFNMMKKITINVLAGGAMGQDVTWDSDKDDKPRPGYKMTYMQSTKTVIEAVAGPIILPIWFLKAYPSFLPGHKLISELGVAIEEFPAHTKHLMQVETERAERDSGHTRSNIASQLLRANRGDDKSHASLTDEELMGNLFVVSAAGFDTTANTLSYALALLCRYPEIQDWMFEEVDELLSDDMGDDLDYVAVFPRVVRIMAIMLETLRLFVPVVHLAKETHGPQVIETSAGTLRAPASCTMYVDVVGLHLIPEIWRDLNLSGIEAEAKKATNVDENALADEHVFRPARWVNPTGSAQPLYQPPRGCYMPWSGGPRICPGQKMAQVEFTAIFLGLFRRHRIEAVPLQIDGHDERVFERNARLDAIMKDSVSLLTLQMQGVYHAADVSGAATGKGVNVRIIKRR